MIELAKQGNPMALKLCFERLLPRRRDRLISLNLPEVKTEADVPQALRAILAAVSRGAITPSEADILMGLVGAAQKAVSKQIPEPKKIIIDPEEFDDPGVRDAYLKLMIAVRESHKRKAQQLPKQTPAPESTSH